MASRSIPPEELDDAQMSAIARDDLCDALRTTLKCIRMVRLPIGRLRRAGETRLLANLLNALRVAEDRNRQALKALAEGRSGAAVACCMELCGAVHDGYFSRDNSDDLDRELQGDAGPLAAQWTQAERQSEMLQRACAHLAEAVIAYSPSLVSKEAKIMSTTNDPSVAQLSEIGAALAMLSGGGAIGSRSARRYEAVADQMAATLDAIGLPRDGVQLASGLNSAAARARLIDSLNRNFDSYERDGTRVYHRTDPQPHTRETFGASGSLLRGRGLVDANLLRAEADAVIGIIDRLPSMARFELAGSADLRLGRDTVRRELDILVEVARDPMGVNIVRAGYQILRVFAGIAEYLDAGEIIEWDRAVADRSMRGQLQAGRTVDEAVEMLVNFRDDELCVETGVVRDEEVRAELANLINLMVSIARRFLVSPSGSQMGAAAARLEELMGAALRSVDQLEIELERSGTGLPEQDVQTQPVANRTARLSIGQFIRWVRAVASPFAAADHRSAELRGIQAALLQGELCELATAADRFSQPTRLGLARPLPRLQLMELSGYLESARDQAALLAGRSRPGTSTTTATV